ncbi:MAG TPA: Asp-tRNA(Asn)/Glu-tRNA(Gln) amidotransferase subunit GatB [Candidatus Paceibacterota bacterium]
MDDKYSATIGLEIHAELKTQTKMFCNSKNDTDEKRPNVNICPICLGYPGTLPTINKEAVKHVIKVGIALGGEISDYTEFDRKNYFYPDIPKGYQISQYKFPLVKGGELNGIKITRVHLEEDTARSIHNEQGTINNGYSLIDFNRAGIPLMELVTEPVIKSAKEASDFAKELQLLLQYLGASNANMEKGEMRVEANVSVKHESGIMNQELGTKVEIKNLNSFRAVDRAIEYEIERHVGLLENGQQIVQETRGWDEVKEETFSQRAKEESHDYRYFPDPDLPKLRISEIPDLTPAHLKTHMPEMPWQKRTHYIENLKIKPEDAEVYVRNRNWGNYFEKVVSSFGLDTSKIQTSSNYITSDLAGLVKNDKDSGFENIDLSSKIPSENFSKLMEMVMDGKISSRGAKDLLGLMYGNNEDPGVLADKHSLLQKSDEGELTKIAEEIIKNNPNVIADYKAGKESALQYLIGQGMKVTKGSVNPEVLKNIFQKII